MTQDEKKEQFIELRIKGETFQSIAEKLTISKQTLINWNKEENIIECLQTAKLMRYQSLLNIYKQDREAKVEYFSKLIQRLKEELEKRDLGKVQTDKLLNLILISEKRLSELIPIYEFKDDSLDAYLENMGKGHPYIINPED